MSSNKYQDLKKHLRKWKIGEYLRQFSIVTAGVVVTFVGGHLITERNTNKEIHSTMQLVKEELQHNLENIRGIDSLINLDRVMATYLNDVNLDIDRIHEDTLSKYQKLLSNTSGLTYQTTAFEVLKNSSLMQKISDKGILMDIANAYDALDKTQTGVKEYYDFKMQNILGVFINFDDDAIRKAKNSIFDYYKLMFESKSARNTLRVIPTFFNFNFFENQKNIVEKGIETIVKNYN